MALWETRTNEGHVDFLCQLSAVRDRTYAGALQQAGGAPGEHAHAGGGCASGACGSGGGCGSRGSGLLQIGGIG
jgi:hypothetical protein